jgi:predicted metal-dependent hydrolase
MSGYTITLTDAEYDAMREQIKTLETAVDRLDLAINTPEIANFLEGVRLEAAHQRQRWGAPHAREKSAEHWFWLIGYLAGKALRSAMTGDVDKARHHCISTAAALSHWHAAITGAQLADADLAAHDADPTPWCIGCGALRKSDCHCGPLSKDD